MRLLMIILLFIEQTGQYLGTLDVGFLRPLRPTSNREHKSTVIGRLQIGNPGACKSGHRLSGKRLRRPARMSLGNRRGDLVKKFRKVSGTQSFTKLSWGQHDPVSSPS
jgi:hypothetical protein